MIYSDFNGEVQIIFNVMFLWLLVVVVGLCIGNWVLVKKKFMLIVVIFNIVGQL